MATPRASAPIPSQHLLHQLKNERDAWRDEVGRLKGHPANWDELRRVQRELVGGVEGLQSVLENQRRGEGGAGQKSPGDGEEEVDLWVRRVGDLVGEFGVSFSFAYLTCFRCLIEL